MAKKKKKRKFSIIISASAVLLFASLAMMLVPLNKQISETKAEIAAVEEAQKKQDAENAKLESVLDSGNMDEYVEKIARDKLGYAMPGERVYNDISAN